MFWVNVCWISLRLWGGSVWKVTTSSASRKRMNITNSVCVSYTNRKKVVKYAFFKSGVCIVDLQYCENMFCIINMTQGSFLLTGQTNQKNSDEQTKTKPWTDTAVLHTPCLERVSNSTSMSGQCCGHSRLIISTTIRDRTSLIWFSSSKMFSVPCKRISDIKRFARLNSKEKTGL